MENLQSTSVNTTNLNLSCFKENVQKLIIDLDCLNFVLQNKLKSFIYTIMISFSILIELFCLYLVKKSKCKLNKSEYVILIAINILFILTKVFWFLNVFQFMLDHSFFGEFGCLFFNAFYIVNFNNFFTMFYFSLIHISSMSRNKCFIQLHKFTSNQKNYIYIISFLIPFSYGIFCLFLNAYKNYFFSMKCLINFIKLSNLVNTTFYFFIYSPLLFGILNYIICICLLLIRYYFSKVNSIAKLKRLKNYLIISLKLLLFSFVFLLNWLNIALINISEEFSKTPFNYSIEIIIFLFDPLFFYPFVLIFINRILRDQLINFLSTLRKKLLCSKAL